MAGARIRGITIELGADATGLSKALSDVNKDLKSTQSQLGDVARLLKLDPKNVELLAQKQKLLKQAIEQTETKLSKLKEAQKNVAEGTKEWDALQREIISTQEYLDDLKKRYKDFGSVASQQLKAVGREIQDAGEKIKGVGEKLAPVSAAAAALGGSLLKLGYDAVTGADDLNTLSKQTGVSTETLQKMQYAADRVDVSVDDITGALVKMKKNMAGNTSAFDKLGISVTNADGSMRSIEDIFNDTIVTLSYVQDEVERDQIAMDIFGKSADSLAGIIDDGGAALKAFGDEAEQAGLILSQDTLDALNETNDTIDTLKANLAGTAAQIGADVASVLAPALEQLAGHVASITEKLRELSPEQTAVILGVIAVVAALAPVIATIATVIKIVGILVATLGGVIGTLTPLIAGIGAFAASFAAPIAAIGAAIAIGVLLYKNWDTICAKAAETKDKVVAKFEEIKTGIATKIEAAKTAASEKIDAIKTKITTTADGIKSAVTTKFEAIKTAITKPIESAKTAVANAIEAIKSKINNANFSLPKIKLPHFSISGNFSLNPPSIPKFSVSWYKKAHQNAVLFTSPTVLPTLNGYKGFGDGGAEVVMDYGKLASMVGDTYITVNAAPGMDVRQLADEVQLRLAQVQKQRASVYV